MQSGHTSPPSDLLVWLFFLPLIFAVKPGVERRNSLSERRELLSCITFNPSIRLDLNVSGPLDDVQVVSLTISGMVRRTPMDVVALFFADADIGSCPSSSVHTLFTGDVKGRLSTCSTPIKTKQLPAYPPAPSPVTLTFRLTNMRSAVKFVLFSGPLLLPCVLQSSAALSFRTPNSPLLGHLGAVDSSEGKLRLTWVSGSPEPQNAVFADSIKGRAWTSVNSTVATFTRPQLCGPPANAEGFHHPGFVHTAVLAGLRAGQQFLYKYGSSAPGVGFSAVYTGHALPRAVPKSLLSSGSSPLTRIVAFGDMGFIDSDGSSTHYRSPGAHSTVSAIHRNEIDGRDSPSSDALLHFGDISYATGHLSVWEQFLEAISPIAHRLPYITVEGNHESDWPNTASFYSKTDSGGECGVPFSTYFPPVSPQSSPWFSLDIGLAHLTVMSTERDWRPGSPQWEWLEEDLNRAVSRQAVVPWIVFVGHREPYSSVPTPALLKSVTGVDYRLAPALEKLSSWKRVDLAMWGHVHSYERTCQLYAGECVGLPSRTTTTLAVYNNNGRVAAPVHTVVGTAGFKLDRVNSHPYPWSMVQASCHGYAKISFFPSHLDFRFVRSNDSATQDHFQVLK